MVKVSARQVSVGHSGEDMENANIDMNNAYGSQAGMMSLK